MPGEIRPPNSLEKPTNQSGTEQPPASEGGFWDNPVIKQFIQEVRYEKRRRGVGGDTGEFGGFRLIQEPEKKGTGEKPPPPPLPKEKEPPHERPKLTVPVPEPSEPPKNVPTEMTVGIAADTTKVDNREEQNKIDFMMRLGQQKSSALPVVGHIAKMVGTGAWQNTILSPIFRERQARWLRNVMRDTGLSDVPENLIIEAMSRANTRITEKRNWVHRNIIDRPFNLGANIVGLNSTNEREAADWIKEQVEMARGLKPTPNGVEISSVIKEALARSAEARKKTGERFSIEDSKDGLVSPLQDNEMRLVLGEKGKRENVSDADLSAEKELARHLQEDFVGMLKDYLDGGSITPEEVRRRIDEYGSAEGYKAANGTVYKLRERLSGKYEVFRDRLTAIGNSMATAAEVFREHKDDYIKLKILDDKLDWKNAFAENKLKLKFYVGEGEINAGEVKGAGDRLVDRLHKKKPREALSARENHSKTAATIAKYLGAIVGNEVTVAAVTGYGTAVIASLIPTSPSKMAALGGAAAVAGEVLGVSAIPVLFTVTAAGAPVVVPIVAASAAAAGIWAGAREALRLTREKSAIEWEAAHGIGAPSVKQVGKLVEPGIKGKIARGALSTVGAITKGLYGKAEREEILKNTAHRRKASELLEGLTTKSKLFKNPADPNSELPEDISGIKTEDVREALRWLTETQARLRIISNRNRFVIDFGTEETDSPYRTLLAGASIAVEERLIHLFRQREDLRREFGIEIDASGNSNFKKVYNDLRNAYEHNILGDTAMPKEEEYKKLVKLLGEEEIGGEKQVKGFIEARYGIAERNKHAALMYLRYGGHRAIGTAITAIGFREIITEVKHFLDNREPPSYLLGQVLLHQAQDVPIPGLPVDMATPPHVFGGLSFRLPQQFSFDDQHHIITAPDHVTTIDLEQMQRAGQLDAGHLTGRLMDAVHQKTSVQPVSEVIFNGIPTAETVGHATIIVPQGVDFVHHTDISSGHEMIDKINLPGKPPIDLSTHPIDTTNQADLTNLQNILHANKLDVTDIKPDGFDTLHSIPDSTTFGLEHVTPTPEGTHWLPTAGQPSGHFDLVDSQNHHIVTNAYYESDGRFEYTDNSGGLLEIASQNQVDHVISDDKWIQDLKDTAINHQAVYGTNGIGFRVENLQGNHGNLVMTVNGHDILTEHKGAITFQDEGKPPLISYDGVTQNTIPDNWKNALEAAGAHFANRDFWPPRIDDTRWNDIVKNLDRFDTQGSHIPGPTTTPVAGLESNPHVPWVPNPDSGEAFPYVRDAFDFIKDGHHMDVRNLFDSAKISPDGKSFTWPSGTVYTPDPSVMKDFIDAKNGVPGAIDKFAFTFARADDWNAAIINPHGMQADLPGGLNIHNEGVWVSWGHLDPATHTFQKFIGMGPTEHVPGKALELSERGYSPVVMSLKVPKFDVNIVSGKEDILNFSTAGSEEAGIVAFGETPTPVTSYADIGTITEGRFEVGVKPVTPTGGWKIVGGTVGGGGVKPLTPEERQSLTDQRVAKLREAKDLYGQIRDVPQSEMTPEQRTARSRYDQLKKELNDIDVRLHPDQAIVVSGVRVLIDERSAQEYQYILEREVEHGSLQPINNDRQELGLPLLSDAQLTNLQTNTEDRKKFIAEMMAKRVTAEILEEKKNRIRAEIEKEPAERAEGEKLEDLYKRYGQAIRDELEKRRVLNEFVARFGNEPEKALTDPGYETVARPHDEASDNREKAGAPLERLEMTIVPQAAGTSFEAVNNTTAATMNPMNALKMSGGLRDRTMQYQAAVARSGTASDEEKELKAAFEKFTDEMQAADRNYKPVTFDDFKKNHATYLERRVMADTSTGAARLIADQVLTREQIETRVNERFERERAEVVKAAESVVPAAILKVLSVVSPSPKPPPKPNSKPQPDDSDRDNHDDDLKKDIKSSFENRRTQELKTIREALAKGKINRMSEDEVFLTLAQGQIQNGEIQKLQAPLIAKLNPAEKKVFDKFNEDHELQQLFQAEWTAKGLDMMDENAQRDGATALIQGLNAKRQAGKRYSSSEIDVFLERLIPMAGELNTAILKLASQKAEEIKRNYYRDIGSIDRAKTEV